MAKTVVGVKKVLAATGPGLNREVRLADAAAAIRPRYQTFQWFQEGFSRDKSGRLVAAGIGACVSLSIVWMIVEGIQNVIIDDTDLEDMGVLVNLSRLAHFLRSKVSPPKKSRSVARGPF